MLARKRGRWARSKEAVHDDLVCRAFGAKAANELWFADITEHPTAEGKLYLCAIKDAFSGRIVGYSMDSHMKASLAVTALHNAIALRCPGGTIVHSDRGSQFRSGKFLRALRSAGLIGSMGRTGTCADNAAMESFFALVRTMSSIVSAGKQERSCAWPSWSGSNGPTTGGVASAPSASSPRSSSKPCTRLLMQREYCQPRESTEVGAVPFMKFESEQPSGFGRRPPPTAAESSSPEWCFFLGQ